MAPDQSTAMQPNHEIKGHVWLDDIPTISFGKTDDLVGSRYNLGRPGVSP